MNADIGEAMESFDRGGSCQEELEALTSKLKAVKKIEDYAYDILKKAK